METLENEYLKQQDQEHRLSEQKNRQYQEVLKACKMLPYSRTVAAYEEACGAAEEYGRIWQSARQELLHIQTEQIGCHGQKRTDRSNTGRIWKKPIRKKELTAPGQKPVRFRSVSWKSI